MKKIKTKELIIIAIICAIIYAANPFALNTSQNLVLVSLLAGMASWATTAVHKTVTSIFLLTAFAIFSNSTPLSIVSFAYSPTMLLIITTTLFSVAIINSGALDEFIKKLFLKFSENTSALLILPYILGLILIPIIPQAFARVIVIGAIFDSALSASDENEASAKKVLMFNVFLAVSMTYMIVPNGDIVLNHAAIKFSGEAIAEQFALTKWLSNMIIPTILSVIAAFIVTKKVFRAELANFSAKMLTRSSSQASTNSKKIVTIACVIALTAMWMTKKYHAIPEWACAAVATLIMFACKTLSKKDLKSVNPHFLIFLTTAFSIGKVLSQSGITQIIFEKLATTLPQTNSFALFFVISLITMILHCFIGSAVATMSVVLPIFLALFPEQSTAAIITYIVYTTVNIQFLLPYHHANMMIGVGKNYYSDKYMLRYGTVITAITPIIIAIYLLSQNIL